MLDRLNLTSFWSRDPMEVFADLADIASRGGQEKCADFFSDYIRSDAEKDAEIAQLEEKIKDLENQDAEALQELQKEHDDLNKDYDEQYNELEAAKKCAAEEHEEKIQLQIELDRVKKLKEKKPAKAKLDESTQALHDRIKLLENQLQIAQNELEKAKL